MTRASYLISQRSMRAGIEEVNLYSLVLTICVKDMGGEMG